MDLSLLNDDIRNEVVDTHLRQRVDQVLSEALDENQDASARMALLTDRYREAYVHRVWLNNGYEHPSDAAFGKKRLSYRELVDAIDRSAHRLKDQMDEADLQDAVHPKDATILLPQVIVSVVKEAIEPQLIGTRLLRQVRVPEAGETITFPAMGALTASDIGTAGEYPETQTEFSGQTMAIIGKSGLKIRLTEEVLRQSQFDIMSMLFQAAGRALARHKEVKVWNLLDSLGTVAFDNSGASSINGKTDGRAADGTKNDTYTVNDLFVQFADLMNAGFVPNLLAMNPMGWLVFARDPVMRNLAFQIGNGSMLWQTPQGQPGMAPHFTPNGAPLGTSGGNTPSATPSQMANATLKTSPPGFFPIPFQVVVSPFVDYDSSARTTTILMADREHLGAIAVAEDVVTESWDDPNRDIQAVKFRERYGLVVDHEGDAITLAKGISLDKSFDFEQKLEWQAGTGALPTG